MAKTRGDKPYVSPLLHGMRQLSRYARAKSTTRRAVPPMPRWTAKQRRLPLNLRKYEKY